MKNLYLFLFLIFISFHVKAQEIYFSSGKNNTSFDYQSSDGSDENLNFRSGSGNYFEVGYIHGLINYKLLYSIGFVYNEFNSKASNYATNYSWKTKYLGIVNKISFNLSKDFSDCSHYGSGLRTFLSVGFNTSTLISGEQYINNYYYNLLGNEDFVGVIVQPFAGINSQYNVSRNFKLMMGYNFSKSFSLFNNSDEKLSFNNHQFQLGFQISINR
tara:strand:- start:363 stop:1007 length:645 start_codon:yes stop_codon:yes gene_type:complete